MSGNLAAILYLVASVCFILALRGLASPESARMGNILGIAGMVIAVATTLASPGVVSYGLIIAGIVIGGAAGTVIALRIQMTALPQLVAAFHSLVGLAAVCVAAAAFYHPAAYGIATAEGIKLSSLIEMSLGTAIGAITFTGSVIAFGKLQALLSGKPLVFPGQHPLNAALGIALVVLIVWFASSGATAAFWLIVALSLALGLLLLPAGVPRPQLIDPDRLYDAEHPTVEASPLLKLMRAGKRPLARRLDEVVRFDGRPGQAARKTPHTGKHGD